MSLEGKTYGPVPWRVAPGAVADFVALTGDDPARWSVSAPPGFAAAALFTVAPDLLAELYDRSVIHGEQTFQWARPIPVDGLVQVSGVVTRERERGGVTFVTFEVTAEDESGPVLTATSLFLLSGETLPAGQPDRDRPEPPHSYDGDPEEGQVSASRADLVKYASATRDWNPVHWDHEAGLAAGFPGVVVHGLLQAGWAMRIASADTASDRPFASARFRFRNPLLPARPVSHTVERKDGSLEVVIHDEDTEYLTATITLADE
ncbi:MAG TPA: MaoC/PaaZ C-terminal domain-containing protein [Acidimicrobiia bacterium]|jgi:acyl dehydratase|nr:MaoC/PaaZ C-terminal domain-containing protein [Acidimicrobiia bacterium]